MQITGIVIAVIAVVALMVVAHFHLWRWLRLLIVAVFIVSVVAAFGAFSSNAGVSANGTAKGVHVDQQKQTKTPANLGPQVSRNNCLDGFNVVIEPHEGNKVSSAKTTGDPTTWPAQVMQIAMHDPAVLQLYWNKTPAGQKNPITNPQQLVGAQGTPDYGCYTAHGRDIWNQTDGAYENATIKAAQAPSVGINTGINAATDAAFQEPAGPITGNLASAQITFQNGDVIYELQRCKNIVTTTAIPGVPVQTPATPATPVVPVTTPTTTTSTTTPCVTTVVGKDVIYCNGTKSCVSSTACGRNGQNAPTVASGGAGGTPNYPPGSAETASGAQTPPANPYQPNPVYGSNPPAGQPSPPGADNGNPAGGGSAGVSAPSGSPNPGGGTAQAPTTTITTTPTGGTTITTSGGNPCADPNTPGCPGAS